MLEGLITAEQYAAAKQWDRQARLYWPAICAPSPDPQAARIGKPARGAEPDPLSRAGQKKARRDRKAVDNFRDALDKLTTLGSAYVVTVREICEGQGRPTEGYAELMRLRKALTGLAVFWRLVAPPPISRSEPQAAREEVAPA